MGKLRSNQKKSLIIGVILIIIGCTGLVIGILIFCDIIMLNIWGYPYIGMIIIFFGGCFLVASFFIFILNFE